MSAAIRPSLILKITLEEGIYSEEAVSEIKRSYSHIAPSAIAACPAGASTPENGMRLVVNLHKPYWDTNDKAADALWHEVMPKWLGNMFYKLSNCMTASNAIRQRQGQPGLFYPWLEIQFGKDALIALGAREDFPLPPDAVNLIEQARVNLNGGVLGEGIHCVRIPARSCIELPLAASQAEEAPDVELKLPVQEIFFDYSVWGIEYQDGTVKEYDTAAGLFVS